MTVSSRDFIGITDLPSITAFFDQARDLVSNNRGFLHAGDVWWRFGRNELEQHLLHLWFESEKLIGLGWLIAGHFEIQSHPNLNDADFDNLAREIVDWAKSACSTEIFTDCFAENSRLIRVLESSGFTPNNDENFLFHFDLTTKIPTVELPSGFQARHVLETEFEKRVNTHQDAFNSTKFTLQRYARVRSMFGYNPELDLVVSTPENELASFCVIWLSGGVGYFEPVGTQAAFRRQGLGRAVILEGFRRLQVLGAQTAEVFAGIKNRDFYESCGFCVVNRFLGYSFKQE